MKNHDNFLGIYDNAFSQEYCEGFIEYINQLENNCLVIPTNEPDHIIDDHFINFSHHYDLKSWTWMGESFLPVAQKYIQQYIQKYSILSPNRYILYDVKAKKIDIGGGFHSWHYENHLYTSCNRVLVAQLYLNTIEEGGETEFLYLNKRINAVQGRLIIFPAGFTHTHRGNPPLGKEKYILTTWLLMQENT